jgi:hypothetical protein
MVNTFIPLPTFDECAKVLDNRRLGKQRVEAKQILNLLTNETKTNAWRNHPVTRMWENYVPALKLYYNTIVKEWIRRGFVNNMPLYELKGKIVIPWFATNTSINYSYQANLIRKDADYYKPKFHPGPPKKWILYTYIWPSKLTSDQVAELIANGDKIVPIQSYSTLVKQK